MSSAGVRCVLLFTMANIFEQLQNARVYDLGQPYFTGMPHYPTHPPFLFGLTKKHGDVVLDGGVSSSADAMALGTHVGTHIDALCQDRKSTRLNSSHQILSYAVFCLKKKNIVHANTTRADPKTAPRPALC